MANPLKSIVEGTSTTVGGVVKDTAGKMMSRVPNPAKAIENLGLGVGTLVRNIRESAKKDKKPATEAQQKKGTEQTSKQIHQMAAQLALTNSLLKEIRNLQVKQIQAVQRGAGGKGVAGPLIRRGPTIGNQQIQGAQPTALQGSLSADTAEKKTAPPTMKWAEMALGGYAVWQLLPKEMKGAFGKLADNLGNDLKPVIVDGIGGIIKNAWNNNAFYTTIAGLYIAHITGILGFTEKMVKGAVSSYKFLDKMIAPSTTTGKAPTTSIQAPVSIAEAPKVTSAAISEYNSRINSPEGARPSLVERDVAAKYGLNEAQMEKVKAGTVEAPKAGMTGIDKARWLGRGFGFAGIGLTLGTGAAEYYQAASAAKRGELSQREAAERKGGAVGGTVGALGMGLAGGALGMKTGATVGSLFGPAGTVIGGLVGGIGGSVLGAMSGGEAGRYIGGTINSINVGDDRIQQQAGRGVNQALSNRADATQSMEIIKKVFASKGFSDLHIRAAQIVAAAESDLKPDAVGDNGASIGLFQLNRVSGEGRGHSVEELMDPTKNAMIVADKMNTEQGLAFRKATTIEEAITALTRDFERPHFVKGNMIADANAFNQYVSRGASRVGQTINGQNLSTAAQVPGTGVTGGVSGTNISSATATSGAAFAQSQETLNQLLSALSGERQVVNLQQIVNNATAQGGGGGGGSGPKRTTPSGGNAAARNANHATGMSAFE